MSLTISKVLQPVGFAISVAFALTLLLMAGPGLAAWTYGSDYMTTFCATHPYLPLSWRYGPIAWAGFIVVMLKAAIGTLRLTNALSHPSGDDKPKLQDRSGFTCVSYITTWSIDLIVATLLTTSFTFDLLLICIGFLRSSEGKISLEHIPRLVAAVVAAQNSVAFSAPISFWLFVTVIVKNKDRQVDEYALRAGRQACIVWLFMLVEAMISITLFVCTVEYLRVPEATIYRPGNPQSGMLLKKFLQEDIRFWHTTLSDLLIFWYRLFVDEWAFFGGYAIGTSLVMTLPSLWTPSPKIWRILIIAVLIFAATYVSMPLSIALLVIVVWIALSTMTAWSNLWLMIVPSTGWFPTSGIAVTDTKQILILQAISVVLVYYLTRWWQDTRHAPNLDGTNLEKPVVPSITSSGSEDTINDSSSSIV
jgi:hypothetical protein